MRRVPKRSRRIFPALLSETEREMLTYLSKESRLSRCAVVRHLILKETATRQLTPPRAHQETAE